MAAISNGKPQLHEILITEETPEAEDAFFDSKMSSRTDELARDLFAQSSATIERTSLTGSAICPLADRLKKAATSTPLQESKKNDLKRESFALPERVGDKKQCSLKASEPFYPIHPGLLMDVDRSSATYPEKTLRVAQMASENAIRLGRPELADTMCAAVEKANRKGASALGEAIILDSDAKYEMAVVRAQTSFASDLRNAFATIGKEIMEIEHVKARRS